MRSRLTLLILQILAPFKISNINQQYRYNRYFEEIYLKSFSTFVCNNNFFKLPFEDFLFDLYYFQHDMLYLCLMFE